jgi:hypothetical protein
VIKWYLNQEDRQRHRGRLSAGRPLCAAAVALTLGAVSAVGLTNDGTLELHWNGSKWAEYPVATENGYFDGVASTSAKNV